MTAQYAAECFCYDETTGVLTWRNRPKSHFPTERGWVSFNAQRSGKVVNSISKAGYIKVGVNGISYLAHRIAWLIATGAWPEADTDHINGVRTDNRLSNLRSVNRSTNAKNTKRKLNNSSGVTGVSWVARDRLWAVQITDNSGGRKATYFKNFDDAKEARKDAERKLNYHPNHGRLERK
jgi:hypothetical protein